MEPLQLDQSPPGGAPGATSSPIQAEAPLAKGSKDPLEHLSPNDNGASGFPGGVTASSVENSPLPHRHPQPPSFSSRVDSSDSSSAPYSSTSGPVHGHANSRHPGHVTQAKSPSPAPESRDPQLTGKQTIFKSFFRSKTYSPKVEEPKVEAPRPRMARRFSTHSFKSFIDHLMHAPSPSPHAPSSDAATPRLHHHQHSHAAAASSSAVAGSSAPSSASHRSASVTSPRGGAAIFDGSYGATTASSTEHSSGGAQRLRYNYRSTLSPDRSSTELEPLPPTFDDLLTLVQEYPDAVKWGKPSKGIVIERDARGKLGFRFVQFPVLTRDAEVGEESYTLVKEVFPGGPAEGKLKPRDRILSVNSQHLQNAHRGIGIEAVMQKCTDKKVRLIVQQPQGIRRSKLPPSHMRSRGSRAPSEVPSGIDVPGAALAAPLSPPTHHNNHQTNELTTRIQSLSISVLGLQLRDV